MSKEAPEAPVVTFCKRKCTEGPMLYSLITNSKRAHLPRTHLANVIIRDNISENRMLELKLKQISGEEKKTLYFKEYLKQKFVIQLHKKTTSWEKEHEAFLKYVHLDETRKRTNATISCGRQQLKKGC